MGLFERRTTSYGGRGVFALEDISSGTLVHSCLPYANVIFRSYRRDVCAWCFAYALGADRPKLVRHIAALDSSVDLAAAEIHGHSQPPIWARKLELRTIWVCANSDCAELWEKHANPNGRFAAAYAKVEHALKGPSTKPPAEEFESDLPPSHEQREEGWKKAASLHKKKLLSTAEELTELEVDTCRFVLSALGRRNHELLDGLKPDEEQDNWADVLDLEDTEALRAAHVLSSNLRNLRFLRRALGDADSQAVPDIRANMDCIRAILGREHSNVFGVFADDSDGGEMLGFSMYVSASYFNHSKQPPPI